MAYKKKYIVCYYGWISGYGDFDMDDFTVKAKNKDEAIQLANQQLKNTLLKGKPHVELYSTYERKCKNYQDKINKLTTPKKEY